MVPLSHFSLMTHAEAFYCVVSQYVSSRGVVCLDVRETTVVGADSTFLVLLCE